MGQALTNHATAMFKAMINTSPETKPGQPQGVVVLAFGPQPMEFLGKASKLCGKAAVVDQDVARMAGAMTAAGPREALDALRQRLEAGALQATQQAKPGISEAAVKWLASGQRGISSNTIFSHLTAIDAMEGWRMDHPYDPADLRRCRLLLEQVPDLVPLFPRMTAVSPEWANLVARWDTICATMDSEAPEWRDGSGWASASKTYDLIKQAVWRK